MSGDAMKWEVDEHGVCRACGYQGRTEDGYCIVHEPADYLGDYLPVIPADASTLFTPRECALCGGETGGPELCRLCEDFAAQYVGVRTRW